MSLNPALIAGSILSAAPMTGIQWPLICQGIGIAIFEWTIAGGVGLVGVSVGGVGPVIGLKMILPPAPALVLSGVTSAGLAGPSAAEIATAVAVGISISVSSFGSYTGVVAGGAIGSPGVDASKVVTANNVMLTSLLVTSFASVGMTGPSAGQLATGLGLGVSLMMMTGTGTGVVPAAGTGGPSISLLQ